MLADALKTLLASNFAYYLKAQQFHWNVEGPDFGELHEFFHNQQMIDILNQCFAEAEQENQQGIADFVSQRLSQHGKYHWQLRSYLKDQRA